MHSRGYRRAKLISGPSKHHFLGQSPGPKIEFCSFFALSCCRVFKPPPGATPPKKNWVICACAQTNVKKLKCDSSRLSSHFSWNHWCCWHCDILFSLWYDCDILPGTKNWPDQNPRLRHINIDNSLESDLSQKKPFNLCTKSNPSEDEKNTPPPCHIPLMFVSDRLDKGNKGNDPRSASIGLIWR